jgi:hypothetical protein
MLDDIREQADGDYFLEDDDDDFVPPPPPKRHFLGMTPGQRFVIAIMLFIITCILSSFCLLVTETVVPPIF